MSKIHGLEDSSVVLGFIGEVEQIPDGKIGEQGRISNCEDEFSQSHGQYFAKRGTLWYLLSSTSEDITRN